MQDESKTIANVLGGSDGVVYLMFLGRKTYAEKIQAPLVKSGFYAHKESVNQAVSRLTKKEHKDLFLKFVEERKKAGRPKIYTANFRPIYLALRKADAEFEEKKFEKTFSTFSFLNDDFPRYLVEQLGDVKGFHKKLRWNHILANYLYYLVIFHFQPYIYETTATLEERKKLDGFVSATLKGFQPNIKMKTVLNQKMAEFLVGYSGGKLSFVKDVMLVMHACLKEHDLTLLAEVKRFTDPEVLKVLEKS